MEPPANMSGSDSHGRRVSLPPQRLRFGWLSFRPDFLQCANHALCLVVCLCLAAAVQGMTVAGFVNVSLTTVERRFYLKSRDLGIISSSASMAYVVSCLPATYFASRPGASKPRWLGGGMLLVALGSFLYSLPHLLTSPYNVVRHDDGEGQHNTSSVLCNSEEADDEYENIYFEVLALDVRYLFILGQILHGMGSAPLLSMAPAFLDEAVDKDKTSFYIGIYNAMGVGGAALGFAGGSVILTQYIDWPIVDPAIHDLTPSSDLWLGCWWLCFLVSGCAAAVVAVLLLAFPPRIPKVLCSEDYQSKSETDASRDSAVVASSSADSNFTAGVTYCAVLTNIPFMALALAEAGPNMLAAGLSTFMPKMIENQFSTSASAAAIIVGAAGVPSGCCGALFGGWILKKLKVSCRGAFRICFLGSISMVLASLSFLVYCPNHDFGGVFVQYENTSSPRQLPDLDSPCNLNCSCSGVSYNPVCGANNVNYYSPCHAGCTVEQHNTQEGATFTNCSCVILLNDAWPSEHHDRGGYNPTASSTLWGSATRDQCASTCTMMPLFLALFVVTVFAAFGLSVASITAGLKCIEGQYRSVAFGVRSLVCRLLAYVIGPIIFGVVIDQTCVLWEQDKGAKGSCLVYEHKRLNRSMMYIYLVVQLVSTVPYGLAMLSYRPGRVTPDEDLPEGDEGKARPTLEPRNGALEGYHNKTDEYF